MNFAVGQRLRAVCTIYEPPGDDTPGCVLAAVGDTLVVRRAGAGTCHVSHEYITDGRMFRVLVEEVEALPDDVLESGGGTWAQAAAAERGEHDDMIREYDRCQPPQSDD